NRKVDDRNGGKNPASVEVSINGIVYNCMKDASNKLNLPYHTIVNKVNSKLHKTWYRIKT
ncbi:hypothetical protein, partial [Streptomyces galilaeus]|uniref:hypothetical protein n=1 Tax=Streptomyces galilaeus TaxID=33899 RepID=UPI0038F6B4CF